MSDYERNKGKLEKVSAEAIKNEFPDVDFDDLPWTTDGKYEKVGEGFYRVYWEVNGATDVPKFAEVSESPDGRFIDFHTYHYNGGAHWTEVVEDALKNRGN